MGIPIYACNPSLQEAEAGRSFWAMYAGRPWGKGKSQALLFLYLSFMECFKGLSRNPVALVYSEFLLSVTLLNDADDT